MRELRDFKRELSKIRIERTIFHFRYDYGLGIRIDSKEPFYNIVKSVGDKKTKQFIKKLFNFLPMDLSILGKLALEFIDSLVYYIGKLVTANPDKIKINVEVLPVKTKATYSR